MRIHLLTGGLILLAAMPVAAQEVSDSTRVIAVPASTPAVPTLQVILNQSAAAAARWLTPDSAAPDAASTMLGVVIAGAVVLLVLRQGGGMRTGDFDAVLRF